MSEKTGKTYWVSAPEYLGTERLLELANDPRCLSAKECLDVLAQRMSAEELTKLREKPLEAKADAERFRREKLTENPFDPRTEVSADAKYVAGQVIKHLWLVFVILPAIWVLIYYAMH